MGWREGSSPCARDGPTFPHTHTPHFIPRQPCLSPRVEGHPEAWHASSQVDTFTISPGTWLHCGTSIPTHFIPPLLSHRKRIRFNVGKHFHQEGHSKLSLLWAPDLRPPWPSPSPTSVHQSWTRFLLTFLPQSCYVRVLWLFLLAYSP